MRQIILTLSLFGSSGSAFAGFATAVHPSAQGAPGSAVLHYTVNGTAPAPTGDRSGQVPRSYSTFRVEVGRTDDRPDEEAVAKPVPQSSGSGGSGRSGAAHGSTGGPGSGGATPSSPTGGMGNGTPATGSSGGIPNVRLSGPTAGTKSDEHPTAVASNPVFQPPVTAVPTYPTSPNAGADTPTSPFTPDVVLVSDNKNPNGGGNLPAGGSNSADVALPAPAPAGLVLAAVGGAALFGLRLRRKRK